MNKHVFLSLAVIAVFFALPKISKATHAAGGEISYEWVSDSTYRIYFKLFRDCAGAGVGTGPVLLCYTNSCNFFTGTKNLTLISKLPDSTNNGSAVSTGCAGVGTRCSSTTSPVPGYQEWWYSGTVTLPYRCNYWTFSVGIGNRNPSNNLVNAGSLQLFVEATLNNLDAQGNSSPYFSVKPVPSVCVNKSYTYNNGGVDRNADSLVFEMARPRHTTGGCPMTTSIINFTSASPSYNITTNPIQTGNSFVLDTVTGQMTFTPTITGPGTLTTRIKEYRSGVLIGTVMRDIQIQVINCNVPGPTVNTISSTISGGTYVNGRVEACAGVTMSFCYDMKSSDTAAKLVASDNHNASAPGSTVTYVGQGTDSIRGCFSWKPGTLDTGLRVFTVTVKDSTCNSPGVLISQTFVLPIYIWPITDIIKDTTLCYGDSVKLVAVGGSNFTWSVLSGGAPISSLSCTTCKEPFAKPLVNTQYRVSNSATQYCSKNSDTVTVNVLDIRYDTLQASSNTPVCEGDTLKLFASTALSGYGYKWRGPGGYSSLVKDPTIPNVLVASAGNYTLSSSKLHCTSIPDTTTVVVNARPAKPTATNNGALCAGVTLNLYATNVSNATYQWTGPGSFNSGLQNPSIANVDTSKAGKYIVRTTSTVNGCISLPDTTTVVINHIPVISSVVTTHPTTCGGSQGKLTLNGLKPNTAYTVNYKNNAVAQTPAVISADNSGILLISGLTSATYSQIKVTLNGCTSDTTTSYILSDPLKPVVTASANAPICAGDTLRLYAGSDSTSVIWSWTGPSSYTSTLQNPVRSNATVAMSGQYILTATKNNCTSEPDTVNVLVHPTPATPTAGSNSPVCAGDTLFLTASIVPGASYDWTGPASFSASTQDPVILNTTTGMSGNYIVTTTANGCISEPDTAIVVINSIPSTPIATTNSPVCAGDTIKLFSSTVSGASYSWQGPSGFTSSLQNPYISNGQISNAGNYTLIATISGCSSVPVLTSVAVNPIPATPVATNGGPYCTGNTIQLNSTNITNAVYSWSGPNSYTAGGNSPSIVNAVSSMSGVYTVIASVDGCPSLPDTTIVFVDSIPAPVVGGTSLSHPTTCGGSDGSITLSGLATNANYTVNFKKNNVAQGPYVLTTNGTGQLTIGSLTAGSYTQLIVTATSGCSSLPVAGIVLTDPPIPTPYLDTFYNATSCNGSDGSIRLAGLQNNTNYAINFTRNGIPQVTQNLTTNNSGKVTIASLDSAIYNITVTAINSCTSGIIGPVVIAEPKTPIVTATNNSPVCQGSSFTLSGTSDSSGVTWSWTGPLSFSSTNQNPVLSNALPAQSGVYTLTATKNNCISIADTTTVIVHPTPATPVAGSNSPLCSGSALRLTSSAISGAVYNWSGPLSFSSATRNPVINNTDTTHTGNYIVTATVNNCVSAADTAVVIIYDVPAIDAYSYTHPTTCGGSQGTITLKGLKTSVAYTVNFKHNSVVQAPQVLTSTGAGHVVITGLSAGTYTGISVTQNNCQSDTLAGIVLTNPNSPVVTAKNNSPVCQGSSFTLSGTSDSSGVTWSWSGPLSFSSTNQNPVLTNAVPAQSGVYTLTATKNNCVSLSDTTTVIVHPTPATPVASSNSPLCSGSTLQLTSSVVGGAVYNWTGPLSFASTSQNPVINNVDTPHTGNYIVTATVNNCVSLADTTVVIVYDVPQIDTYSYTHPTTCGGSQGTITLKGLKTSIAYTVNFKHNNIAQAPQVLTSTAAGHVVITGLSAGTYTGITVTQNNCQSDTLAGIVLTNPNSPVVTATNNSPVCQDGSFILSGTSDSSGVTWSWTGPLSFSSTNQNPVLTNAVPAQSGVYTLTATKNNCLSLSDTTTVIVHPTPATPVANSNSPLCSGSTLQLTSSVVSGAVYNWSGPLSFSSTTRNPVINNVDTPHTGNYIVTATVNNCVSVADTAVVIVYDVPQIDTYSYTHPTSCGGSQGTITLKGLKTSVAYTVNFKHDNTAQAPQVLTSTGAGHVVITGLSAGTYTGISVTQNNCQSDTLTGIVLTDPNKPVVTATNNSPVCQGSSFTLSGTSDSSGVTWSWAGPLSFSSTNQNPVLTNVLPAQSGLYTLTATKNNCVSLSDTTIVIVHPTPATPVASSNSPLCSGSNLQLTSSVVSGAVYNWSGPLSFSSTSQNPVINNVDTPHTGNYIVTATVNNCVSVADTAAVIVYDVPQIDTYAYSNPTTCGGSQGTITLKGLKTSVAYTVNFKHNNTAQAPQVLTSTGAGHVVIAGLSAGTYTGISVTQNNCQSDTLAGIVLTDPNSPVVTATNNSPVCQGSSFTLSGTSDSSGVTWSWTGPLSFSSTNQNPVVTNAVPAQSGVYTLTATKNNCISLSDTTTVTVHPTPATPVASSNSPLCSGNTLNLFADSVSGGTFVWSGPLSFSSGVQNPILANAQPAMSGKYFVAVIVNNCISLQDSTAVTVYPLPAPITGTTIAVNPTTCNGSNGSIIINGLNANATYTVNYKKNGVAQSAASLTANGSGTLAILSLTASNYTNITVTSINGCTSDPLPLIVLTDPTPPTIYIGPVTNPTTCSGSDGTISVGGFANNTNYNISFRKNSMSVGPITLTSNTSGFITISGLTKGYYDSIHAEIYNCYSNTVAAVTLTDPNSPVVTATNNSPVCQDGSFTLSGTSDSSGVTWSWTGPLSFSSTNQNPVVSNVLPAQSGVYTLTVTKNNCLSLSDTTTVIVHPIPPTPVANSNSPLCSGSTLQLTSSVVSGAVYNWSGPLSFSSTTRNPVINNVDTPHTGNYIVTATVNNCVSVADTAVVIVYDVPQIDTYSYTHPTSCGGSQGTITLKGLKTSVAYTVNFKHNNIAQAPQVLTNTGTGHVIITGLSAGTYTGITVTQNNCQSDTVTAIILSDPNKPVVTATNNSPVCQGSNFALSARSDSSGVTWSWTGPLSFSSTNQNPVVTNAVPTQSGIYTLTATKNNCTSLSDTTTVIVHPTPATPVANSNSPLCSGSNLQLTSSVVGGAVYNWTGPLLFASTSQNPVINNVDTPHTGNYIVTATVNNCISVADTAVVIVYDVPQIDTYSYTHPTTCGGSQGTITLKGLKTSVAYTVNFKHNNTPQAPQVLTSNGAGHVVITGLSAGIYTGISVTQNNCQSDTVAAIILSDPNKPVVTATNNSPVCQGSSFTLSGTSDSAGVTWSWSGPLSFSSTNQNPVLTNAVPAQSGIYTLTATKNNCISLSDTTTVIVYPTPSTPVANSNSPLCSGSTLQLTSSVVSGAVYNWTGPLSFASTSQNPVINNVDTPHTGNYIVTATVNNCVSVADTTAVIVYDVPQIDTYAYSHPTTCGGSQGTITLTGLLGNTVYTVNVNKNSIAQPAQVLVSDIAGNITISSLTSGIYSGITVTRNNCISDSIPVIILKDPNAPGAYASNNTPICEGGSFNLSGGADSTGVTWSWSGPMSYTSSLQNPAVINGQPLMSGIYTLSVVKNNCTSFDTTYVLVHPTPPTPIATNNTPVCSGNAINLFASAIPGAGYSWTGPNSYVSTLQNPAIAIADTIHNGSYIVTATVNGCVSLPGTTVVTVYHRPNITGMSYTHPTTCSGTQGTITLSGMVRNSSFTVTYKKNGVLQPVLTLPSNATGLVTISSLGAGTYDSIRVAVQMCPSNIMGPVVLTDPTAPKAFTGNDTTVCQGDNVQLKGSSDSTGVVWSWTGPSGYTSASQNPVLTSVLPPQSGNYYLTVAKFNCISVPDTMSVTVHPTPPTPVATNNGPLCPVDILYLSAQVIPGGKYNWSGPNGYTDTGRTPSIPNVQPNMSGIYTATVTVNGCISAPGNTTVVVNVTPPAPTVQPWVYLCEGVTATPLSAIGTNLLWYTAATGGTGNATAPVPSTTIPGSNSWYVSQTVNNCEGPRAQINVLVRPRPALPIVEPDTYQYCEGASTLTLKATGTNLLWYTTATGGTGSTNAPTPSSSITGIFKWYVSQTDANGCESGRDSAVITITPVFVADLVTSGDTICVYDNLIVYDNNQYDSSLSYVWDFDGADIINGDTSGPYTLSWNNAGLKAISLSIDNSPCDEPDTVQVYVAPLPDSRFTAAGHGCINEDIELVPVSKAGSTYLWSLDGGELLDKGNKIYAANWSIPGDKFIVLIVYSDFGCTSGPYSQLLTIHDKPIADIENVSSYDVCAADTITLQAAYTENIKYSWQSATVLSGKEGLQTSAIVKEPSLVVLITENEWGCKNTDTALLTAHACCSIVLPNAFTPNNDGLNDRFRIITDGNQTIGKFIIVDRWGKKLFETNNVIEGWDGTFKGTPAEIGTYYYYVKYTCTDQHVFEEKGEVILMR